MLELKLKNDMKIVTPISLKTNHQLLITSKWILKSDCTKLWNSLLNMEEKMSYLNICFKNTENAICTGIC